MPTLYVIHKPDWSWAGDSLQSALKRLPEGMFEIKITKVSANRSLEQNSYYWGVVMPILAQETWEDHESIHEALLAKFASKRVKSKKDKRFWLLTKKRSKTMNTAEFTEYLDKVIRWAGDFGVIIPLPK